MAPSFFAKRANALGNQLASITIPKCTRNDDQCLAEKAEVLKSPKAFSGS
jgi:hypothetical protein